MQCSKCLRGEAVDCYSWIYTLDICQHVCFGHPTENIFIIKPPTSCVHNVCDMRSFNICWKTSLKHKVSNYIQYGHWGEMAATVDDDNTVVSFIIVSLIKSSYTALSQRVTQSSAEDVYLWDSTNSRDVLLSWWFMPFVLLMCFCQMHFKCNVCDIILMCVMFVNHLKIQQSHLLSCWSWNCCCVVPQKIWAYCLYKYFRLYWQIYEFLNFETVVWLKELWKCLNPWYFRIYGS